MEIIDSTNADRPLNLGVQRLKISSDLGNVFSELLEVDKIQLNIEDQAELKKLVSEINSNKSNRKIVHSNSINVTASLLRMYDPNMIVGSNDGNLKDVLNQITHQLGLPEALSSAGAIFERLISKEKVAVVILNCDDELKVEKSFKSIPPDGILVFSN